MPSAQTPVDNPETTVDEESAGPKKKKKKKKKKDKEFKFFSTFYDEALSIQLELFKNLEVLDVAKYEGLVGDDSSSSKSGPADDGGRREEDANDDVIDQA
ncbi:hypothetical protein ACLB2K_047213 [Fragaria x ananassa]